MKMKLNNKDFYVGDMEFSEYKHPEYTTLKIIPKLGELEREIGLIKECINLLDNPIFVNYNDVSGCSSGYVPINLIDVCDNLYLVDVFDDILSANLEIYDESNKIKVVDEFIDVFSANKLIRVEKNASVGKNTIVNLNAEICISHDILDMDKYVLWELSDSYVKIYVRDDVNDNFIEHFKWWINSPNTSLNTTNTLNYDNLINMCIMVKNAGEMFRDILEQNRQFVDEWTILDTGSTDNTIDIIKDVMKDKKGTLYQEPFINFRESRNRCLDLAAKSCKYTIMLDDTYVLKGGVREFLNSVRGDQYSDSFSAMIKGGDFIYGSNRILKADRELRYIYKIHEIITPENNVCVEIPFDKFYLHDYDNKYMKERTIKRKRNDLELLFKEIDENPGLPRHIYYVAKTYMELKEWDKAYEYFEKRANHPIKGYSEEVTDSLLNCGYLSQNKLNSDWEISKKWYMKCYENDPGRPEAMYFIGNYYSNGDNDGKNNYDLIKAYTYLKKAFEIGFPQGYGANLRHNLYNFIIPKELTSICYQMHDHYLGRYCVDRYLEHAINNDNNDINGCDVIIMSSWKKIFDLLAVCHINGSDNYKLKKDKPILCIIGEFENNIFEESDFREHYDVNIFNEKNISKFLYFIVSYIVDSVIIFNSSEYIPISERNNVKNVYLFVDDVEKCGIVIPISQQLKTIYTINDKVKNDFSNKFSMLNNITEIYDFEKDELIEKLCLNSQNSQNSQNDQNSQCGQNGRDDNDDYQLNYAGMLNWVSNVPHGTKTIFEKMLDTYKKTRLPHQKLHNGFPKVTKILEIGTYSGTSLINILERIPNSIGTAVDMWTNYGETQLLASIENNKIEQVFWDNVNAANMGDRINGFKGDSTDILMNMVKNNEKYDIIYIDGSHKCLDCYSDMVLSWNLLENNGMMIIDDYEWIPNKNNTILNKPKEAVNFFMKRYENKCTIMSIGFRVFLRKNF
jgi:predicted O-methyltransferase YrrM